MDIRNFLGSWVLIWAVFICDMIRWPPMPSLDAPPLASLIDSFAARVHFGSVWPPEGCGDSVSGLDQRTAAAPQRIEISWW